MKSCLSPGQDGKDRETAPDGAEAHRRIFGGRDLTTAFESGAFSESIADGTFRDIFPGDFIVRQAAVPDIRRNGMVLIPGREYTVRFIIADLDAALSSGPGVTAHHAVIVPENPPFEAYMNPDETTEGGYAGSFMQRTVMPAFARGLEDAFGQSHLLHFSADGESCACRLMTLSMVFGETLPGPWVWSDFEMDSFLGGAQLAAFHLNPDLRGRGMFYWLSDVSRYTLFAHAAGVGDEVFAGADDVWLESGVRPFALLV